MVNHPISQALSANRYKVLALGVLLLTSAFSVCLVAVRAAVTHHLTFAGLVWNLFLAWIPLLFAVLATSLRGRVWFIFFTLAWLLFFPNAPYILTDVIHYFPREGVPYWYDLVLVLSFAWSGFLLGYLSLFLMQRRVQRWFGNIVSWVFVLVSLAAGSFGIYLGRFQRFNSWDVLTQPHDLFYEIYHRVVHPLQHWRTYSVSLLFTVFLMGLYLTLYAFTHLPRESETTRTNF